VRVLDRLAAEVRHVDLLAGLDDRAADGARAGEHVEQLFAVAPADRPLQRGEVLGEARQHLEDGVLVVQADVAPHGRVGGGEAREIAEAGGGIFDHFRLGHRLQVVRRADDVVGDDVRQVRDDGEHHVVVLGVHGVDVGAAAPPEFRQPLQRLRIGAGQRREDAPAVLEQVGEAGIRTRFFRAGQRMAGDEMHAGRHVRPHLRDDRALVEPTSVTMAPGFSAGAISAATAPEAADRHRDDDEIGIARRLGRVRRVGVAEAEFLGALQRGCAAGGDRRSRRPASRGG
jgi:hypothetical protein